MDMRFYGLLLALFVAVKSFAQTEDLILNNELPRHKRYKTLALSLSPCAMFDGYNGSAYKVGLSFKPFKNWRLSADGGSYLKGLSKTYAFLYDIKGLHLRTSVGYRSSKTGRFNYGFAYNYRVQSFLQNKIESGEILYTAEIDKKVHSINSFIGWDIYLGNSNSWYIEFRLEAGARSLHIRNSQNELIENPGFLVLRRFSRIHTNHSGVVPHAELAVRLNFLPWINRE